jgi:alpha-tubulin suppressor-like RCC1 family protein
MPAGSVSDLYRLFIAALLAGGLATACKQTHLVLDSVSDGGPSDTGGAGGGDGGGIPVKTVSMAWNHTCAIANGALYCWGANSDGRLGVGDMTDHKTPMRVGDGTDWVDIQVAAISSLGLKQDGTIWAFGGNVNGQLGLGDFMPQKEPTQIGTRKDWKAIATRFDHACALAADATVWCWGKGLEGQLGQDDPGPRGDAMDRPRPTQVTKIEDVAMIDTGQGHTCAIKLDHTLWCWGRNTSSILSQGAGSAERIYHPVQVGSDSDWQRISTGQAASCGLRGGRVYCWGENDESQLRSPAEKVIPAPTLIPAPSGAVGLTFNTFGGCSFDGLGVGACWGRNAEGQLGLGNEDTPDNVVTLLFRDWTWLSAGRFSTCGVRNDGIWCTGANDTGQLGLGTIKRVASFVEVDLQL